MIVLTQDQVRTIEAHARETYPEECCGFLIGPLAEPRRVTSARRARNVVEENRQRRYVVDPLEQLRTEKALAGTGEAILGYYHSHPDHPAEPSEFDRSHAWPSYSYVILSVEDGRPAALRAWVLDKETSTFRSEPLTVG